MSQPNKVFDYDCRETAKNYVNIASVLAGFAFTAVVLVLDHPFEPNTEIGFLKDRASISFLIGFFGCMIASFSFSILAGEGESTNSKAYSMLLLGGGGFTLAGAYLFWGLVPLIKMYASADILDVARWIFGIIVLFVVLNLNLGAIDIMNVSRRARASYSLISFSDYSRLILISFSPLLLFFILKNAYPEVCIVANGYYKSTVIVSLIVISLGAVFSAIASNFKEDYKLSLNQSIAWIFIHSLILGLLVLTLP